MMAQLWLPILLSAVFVFIASALINMLLKFWHSPDYRGFANEDEIAGEQRHDLSHRCTEHFADSDFFCTARGGINHETEQSQTTNEDRQASGPLQ